MAAVLRHPLRTLQTLARHWAYRRQGPDHSPLRLHRRRIYILPTRSGAAMAIVIVGIVLAAMNYSNSMGFLLGFTLAALALVSMHHCHRQLTGLLIRSGRPSRGFVGEIQTLSLSVESDDRVDRCDLLLTDESGEPRDVTNLAAGQQARLALPVTPGRRGPLRIRRFGIESRYPFGLFRAWCWLDLPLEGLAWPTPLNSEPRHADDPEDDSGQREQAGTEDFARLRDYVGGDPIARLLWRHYLARDELVVKEFASPAGESAIWFDWEQSGPGDTEVRLSRLTHWVLKAEADDQVWGLRLADQAIGPGRGASQTRQALDALALFQQERSPDE
ncbi:DUF58 domain-containing protein [Natronospira bacteriovora]|uniref:DUF58 domain-containing protein n=1 Tax=Natronospira bacteriovora TaxID=3069753 RepID=A0ABU0W7J2_9GAMM|nr:DUF58 domain-containing protein [Natronospira sp. AB-CW4]MDQ2069430.1 DUF58 domain-containing protein [Natronospira sp. AB-CW4]